MHGAPPCELRVQPASALPLTLEHKPLRIAIAEPDWQRRSRRAPHNKANGEGESIAGLARRSYRLARVARVKLRSVHDDAFARLHAWVLKLERRVFPRIVALMQLGCDVIELEKLAFVLRRLAWRTTRAAGGLVPSDALIKGVRPCEIDRMLMLCWRLRVIDEDEIAVLITIAHEAPRLKAGDVTKGAPLIISVYNRKQSAIKMCVTPRQYLFEAYALAIQRHGRQQLYQQLFQQSSFVDWSAPLL